jgi:small subunit ribosomal protein S17
MDKKTTDNKVIVRTLTGQVVSIAMDKTINVMVVSKKMHPKYKKSYKVSKKYHVHDEKEIAKVEDKIRFVACRPISKTKRWRLLEVIK